MRAKINLHAHERTSLDSWTSGDAMAFAYSTQNYEAVGLVAHEARPPEPEPRFTTVATGIEHGAGDGTVEPHVVEFPDHDFRFLAHPALTWPDSTKLHVREWLRSHDVDGVEKYSAGRVQFQGDLDVDDVVLLANDDAHNPRQIGASYMTIDGLPLTFGEALEAIRAGDHELHNESPSTIGQLEKSACVAAHRLGTLCGRARPVIQR